MKNDCDPQTGDLGGGISTDLRYLPVSGEVRV